MGPSGSGKTTLLNALAGQVGVQKNLDLAGEVLVNGQPMELSQHRQGYVQQEDMFFSQLTVRSDCARACFVWHSVCACTEGKTIRRMCQMFDYCCQLVSCSSAIPLQHMYFSTGLKSLPVL